MDFLSFLTLCGGLFLFLFGMRVMSKGLEKASDGKLKAVLERITTGKLRQLLLGAAVTAAVQSSSSLTAILIGLVDSGALPFESTVGVIIGSNIGTTATAWLLCAGKAAETGIIKPASVALAAAALGIVLLFRKRNISRAFGTAMLGFAALMSGMELMTRSVAPLAEAEGLRDLLTAFDNPIAGIILGALFTAVIQSSSASVGILQALSMSGAVSVISAAPIIAGMNIGTCVTAALSSVGAGNEAKRVTALHIVFNTVGAALFTPLIYFLNLVTGFGEHSADPVTIAVLHTSFNIFTAPILLPLSSRFIKPKKKGLPH